MVHGAPGHNRWRVVETPLPVKTQGGTMNCFSFNSSHQVLLQGGFEVSLSRSPKPYQTLGESSGY